MSIPNIPDINIDREDSINIAIASIGLQELGLAHILMREAKKYNHF